MHADGQPDPEQLLAEARQGRRDSLGVLLELYRNYLHLLARTQMDLHLPGRADASDLVQETFLDACRDFGHFRGQTEGELVAWLRKILGYNLARLVQQQLSTKKRDVRREISLEQHLAGLEQSSANFDAALRAASQLAQCPGPPARAGGRGGRYSGPLAGGLPRGHCAAEPGGLGV